jgi:hypothetical protein
MTVVPPADVIDVFLDGAAVVLGAIAEPIISEAWDRASVLEEQPVSGLAGHMARGIWIVGEYLAAGPPAGPPNFNSAAEYFSVLCDAASEDTHRANWVREAELVPVGHDQLVATLATRLEGLREELRRSSGDRLVAVFARLVIRLNDYLVTRIVEQVVHLDDLARSVGRDPWPTPAADELVIAVGAEVGLRRRGATAMLRALYRDGFTETTLPVL